MTDWLAVTSCVAVGTALGFVTAHYVIVFIKLWDDRHYR